MQWSGYQEQVIKVDWTRVSNRAELTALANEIRLTTRKYTGGATNIGGALEYCHDLLKSAPERSTRRVIDMVADGTNNVNFGPHFARDIIVAQGVTINGLAITNTVDGLVNYFSNCPGTPRNNFLAS